ncbi:hypothetical protein [Enterococcus sp. AZ051]|uniref:hypothetical protein n=1 Tax=Enterococcus sp. AZ051 TaxID=2774698 RepID=UPI003D2ABE2E
MSKKYYIVMEDASDKLYAYFPGTMLCWTDRKDVAAELDADRADFLVANLQESGDEDFYKEECSVLTEEITNYEELN